MKWMKQHVHRCTRDCRCFPAFGAINIAFNRSKALCQRTLSSPRQGLAARSTPTHMQCAGKICGYLQHISRRSFTWQRQHLVFKMAFNLDDGSCPRPYFAVSKEALQHIYTNDREGVAMLKIDIAVGDQCMAHRGICRWRHPAASEHELYAFDFVTQTR